ncbi:hypothetical protein KXD40_000867 [Peronospora effusa]|nr:hypothetical protein KXD40_000867 [Peronospora effusa]
MLYLTTSAIQKITLWLDKETDVEALERKLSIKNVPEDVAKETARMYVEYWSTLVASPHNYHLHVDESEEKCCDAYDVVLVGVPFLAYNEAHAKSFDYLQFTIYSH